MTARLSRFAFLLALLLAGLAVHAPSAARGDDPAPTDGGAGMEGGPAPDTAPDAASDDEEDGPVPFLEAVAKAIDRGVVWLKKKQLKDGSWGPITAESFYDKNAKGTPYQRPAGSTGLALYTLLKCGVPVDDPVVKKGFAFLKAKYPKPGDTYEVSIVLLAVTATADPFKKSKDSRSAGEKVRLTGDWRKWAMELQQTLIRRHKQLGWRYNEEVAGSVFSTPPGGNQDLSSTQLAVLALFSAERCGIATPSEVYRDVMTFARAQQEPEGPEVPRAVVARPPKGKTPAKPDDRYGKPAGSEPPKDRARGFCYIADKKLPEKEWKATGAMTGCGISIFQMARYVLMGRDDKVWKAVDAKAIQQAIYDGYAWLDANWSASSNPVGNWYHVYYAYCVERACDLTGNSLIGSHAWYPEMGGHLVSTQKEGAGPEEGYWDTQSTHGPKDVLDTCFALLFLKRATRGGIPNPSVTGGSDEPPRDGRDTER
jgi:hypothetical protein